MTISTEEYFDKWCCMTVLPAPKARRTEVPPFKTGNCVSRILKPVSIILVVGFSLLQWEHSSQAIAEPWRKRLVAFIVCSFGDRRFDVVLTCFLNWVMVTSPKKEKGTMILWTNLPSGQFLNSRRARAYRYFTNGLKTPKFLFIQWVSRHRG